MQFSTLVIVPWAVSKAGLVQSIIIMIIIGIIMAYTANLIAKNSYRLIGKCSRIEDRKEMPEFSIVLHHYLGTFFILSARSDLSICGQIIYRSRSKILAPVKKGLVLLGRRTIFGLKIAKT